MAYHRFVIFLIILATFGTLVSGFKVTSLKTSPLSSVKVIEKCLIPAVLVASEYVVTLPQPVLADDGANSFLLPLIISFATIIPFVAYQQALKPKPRTVKQIELDKNLRPKDKSVNVGGVNKNAKATKK